MIHNNNIMETIIIILAILAGVIGIAGSILPGLPGTPISWVGLLILYIWGLKPVMYAVVNSRCAVFLSSV